MHSYQAKGAQTEMGTPTKRSLRVRVYEDFAAKQERHPELADAHQDRDEQTLRELQLNLAP